MSERPRIDSIHDYLHETGLIVVAGERQTEDSFRDICKTCGAKEQFEDVTDHFKKFHFEIYTMVCIALEGVNI